MLFNETYTQRSCDSLKIKFQEVRFVFPASECIYVYSDSYVLTTVSIPFNEDDRSVDELDVDKSILPVCELCAIKNYFLPLKFALRNPNSIQLAKSQKL